MTGLAGLGSSALRQGLIKTEVGKDADLAAFVRSEEELVEYEGMLVSGAVAQRRGWVAQTFDSTWLCRCQMCCMVVQDPQ